jgi:hypothetical protein
VLRLGNQAGQKGVWPFFVSLVTFWVVAIITHYGRGPEWQLFGWRLYKRRGRSEKSIRIIRVMPHAPPALADRLNQ